MCSTQSTRSTHPEYPLVVTKTWNWKILKQLKYFDVCFAAQRGDRFAAWPGTLCYPTLVNLCSGCTHYFHSCPSTTHIYIFYHDIWTACLARSTQSFSFSFFYFSSFFSLSWQCRYLYSYTQLFSGRALFLFSVLETLNRPRVIYLSRRLQRRTVCRIMSASARWMHWLFSRQLLADFPPADYISTIWYI